ncbi:hypothetical protein P3S68_002103 [Capsicum galapagoense]
MKTFKPYTDKVKDTFIYALKAQLKGVTVLTSSVEVADEDEDLGDHHYVPSPPYACDHAGSSGLKPSPDASNDDDLRQRVALLEKSLLDITSFVRDKRLGRIEKKKKKQEEVHLDNLPRSRHQLNLKELVVTVTDMAAADEKGKEEKKEEETEEENAADEEEEEEEEKEKHEEMTAEAEEENEEKTKEDGEKKSEKDKNEKEVEEELVVEQEVENIKEEKKSSKEEEKKNEKKEVEEEEKKHKEKEVDVMGIVAELNQENK